MKKLLLTLCVGAFILSACATDDDVIIVDKAGKKKYRVVKKTDRDGVSEIIYSK